MQIKKTGSKDQHIKALVYAGSGHGKTFLASTLKGKTLIISAEAGLLSIKSEIDFVDISEQFGPTAKLTAFKNILQEVQKGVDYDNIFIDSLTEISQILVEYFQLKYPEKRESMSLWGDYSKAMRGIVKELRDLGNRYNVVVVALEKAEKDEVGRRWKIPDLAGSIATQLPAFFDEVYTIRFLEEGKRAIQTDSRDGYLCKTRGGNLAPFENMNLGEIFTKINGG